MELVTFRIPRKRADHTPVIVRPLGDFQYNGKRSATAVELLKRDIHETLEQGGYFLGMGDYTDFMSPSNRQRRKSAAFYDTAEDAIDDHAGELVQELYETVLKPTTGRWIGLLEGHHFAELKTGETTDMMLCRLLKTRHLGTEAGIRLQFEITGSRQNVCIWAHHGVGGGSTEGAPLNKLERQATRWGGFDIFCMGHTTKGAQTPMDRVYPRWHGRGAPDLVHKTIHLVNTGGYCKAHIVGNRHGRVPRGDYAEQGMMAPAHLGSPVIKITPWMRSHEQDGDKHGWWAPIVKVEA